MNPDQVNQLLSTLSEIAKALSTTKTYTITGAADWPILVVAGSGVVGLIGLMWYDIRSKITDQKTDNVKEHDTIWQAMRDCQHDCCPRGKD